MSTATAPTRPTVAGTRGADERPSLAVLTRLELRKMHDTRAGFWLLAGILGLTGLVVALMVVLGDADGRTMQHLMAGAVQPSGLLLPVVGILLVTSEFSQRTAMATFALVPGRATVLLAKLGACLVLSVVALLVCRVVASVGVLAAGGAITDAWQLHRWMFLQSFAFIATGMVMGLGFGVLLRASAPAIVLYFVLPVGFALAGGLAFMKDAARWLDGSQTLAPLTDHSFDATHWARAATTLAVWMLVPLLVGAWRLMRSDVS